MARWTSADIPSQVGRVAIVTGTGGLGFETALALSKAGASIILAGRNAENGASSIATIRDQCPEALVRFAPLDLSRLSSVTAFCEEFAASDSRLDLLINNAGVMNPPRRMETADGFELQFGTNYLGHFALTAKLLPLLKGEHKARIVSLSSVAARQGHIHFADLDFANGYKPMSAYSQSKLACLMFALELQRRSLANGWGLQSMAAHPGISRTNLLLNTPGGFGAAGVARKTLAFLFQPSWQGALPTLFAATADEARGGAYYGPDGLGEIRGYPAEARIPEAAKDSDAALRLWEASERLCNSGFS